MKALAAEIECRSDVAAARVAVRVAVREARARLAQARLLLEIEPSSATRRAYAEAEFACVQGERNERALSKTTRGVAAH